MAASSSGLPQAAPSPPAAASTKGLVRVEHKYTERHVRVCLKAALDQHSVGIMVSSAYALAKEAGFPSMEKAVRLSLLFLAKMRLTLRLRARSCTVAAQDGDD